MPTLITTSTSPRANRALRCRPSASAKLLAKDQGAELVRKMGRKNFALMPDVFHMNIEDAHIGETLIRNTEMVKYVHLADTNRLSCGDGHMDWDDIFSALGKINYNGWCSVECFPVPDAITAAERTVKFLRERYI